MKWTGGCNVCCSFSGPQRNSADAALRDAQRHISSNHGSSQQNAAVAIPTH